MVICPPALTPARTKPGATHDKGGDLFLSSRGQGSPGGTPGRRTARRGSNPGRSFGFERPSPRPPVSAWSHSVAADGARPFAHQWPQALPPAGCAPAHALPVACDRVRRVRLGCGGPGEHAAAADGRPPRPWRPLRVPHREPSIMNASDQTWPVELGARSPRTALPLHCSLSSDWPSADPLSEGAMIPGLLWTQLSLRLIDSRY